MPRRTSRLVLPLRSGDSYGESRCIGKSHAIAERLDHNVVSLRMKVDQQSEPYGPSSIIGCERVQTHNGLTTHRLQRYQGMTYLTDILIRRSMLQLPSSQIQLS